MRLQNYLRPLFTSPKSFYRHYVADDSINELNKMLIDEIMKYPVHTAFEFGCGTGKIMQVLNQKGVQVKGIDISAKAVEIAQAKGLDAYRGDENDIKRMPHCDVAYTCSVLDHIPQVSKIINDLSEIAKVVIIAETTDISARFYYSHNYEMLGFTKLKHQWHAPDKTTYHIYIMEMFIKSVERGELF